jgi:hypothetical protein
MAASPANIVLASIGFVTAGIFNYAVPVRIAEILPTGAAISTRIRTVLLEICPAWQFIVL